MVSVLCDLSTLSLVLGTVYAITIVTGLLNDSSKAKFIIRSPVTYTALTHLKIRGSNSLQFLNRGSKGTIYACHPHGILPCSTFFFLSNKIPTVVDKMILSTFLGLYLFKYIGYIDNARKTIIDNVAQHGSVALYPGGADEMCFTKGDSKDITIYIREGFMRLAIEHEYRIVPTLAPFEEESYIPLFTEYSSFKHMLWTKYKLSIAPHIGSYGMIGMPRQTNNPIVYYCNEILCEKHNTVEEISAKFKQSLSTKCDELGIKCTFIHNKKLA